MKVEGGKTFWQMNEEDSSKYFLGLSDHSYSAQANRLVVQKSFNAIRLFAFEQFWPGQSPILVVLYTNYGPPFSWIDPKFL